MKVLPAPRTTRRLERRLSEERPFFTVQQASRSRGFGLDAGVAGVGGVLACRASSAAGLEGWRPIAASGSKGRRATRRRALSPPMPLPSLSCERHEPCQQGGGPQRRGHQPEDCSLPRRSSQEPARLSQKPLSVRFLPSVKRSGAESHADDGGAARGDSQRWRRSEERRISCVQSQDSSVSLMSSDRSPAQASAASRETPSGPPSSQSSSSQNAEYVALVRSCVIQTRPRLPM